TSSVQLVSVDTVAPTVPQGLAGRALGSRRVELTWQASTDDRAGTIRYRIFRSGVKVATVTTISFIDRPPTVGKYTYKIRAVDAARNKSAFTPGLVVKAI
ncbi:MAG TPA: fibronectin type III domain-containing protein, partial [Candidatus Caenarcaniphilales bacterium]|nr:fibronectin type III domain-containing protein [Candidatus Caenarcaniphilales bacterium]